MKKFLIGIMLLSLFGCGNPEFCGEAFDENDFAHLKGKVEGDGLEVAMHLSVAIGKKFEIIKRLK